MLKDSPKLTKRFFMSSLGTFVLLFIILTELLYADDITNDDILKYKELKVKILNEIEFSRNNIDIITEELHEIQKIKKIIEDIDTESSIYKNSFAIIRNKSIDLFFKYRGLRHTSILDKLENEDYIIDKNEIKNELEKKYNHHKNTIDCFSVNNLNIDTNCKDMYKIRNYFNWSEASEVFYSSAGDLNRYDYYGATDGKLFEYSVDDSFSLNKIFYYPKNYPENYYENEKERFINLLLDEYQIYILELYAKITKNFEPKFISVWDKKVSDLDICYPYDDQSFFGCCVKAEDSDNLYFDKASIIYEKFPNDFQAFALNSWIEANKKRCYNYTENRCSNVYFIKNTAILKYETESCKIREVTKNDIINDMEEFSSFAEKLKHGEILDLINFCQTSYDNNYFWRFVEPKQSTGCKFM